MIKRDILADCFQVGLKLITYSSSGSQAVKADLMRSGLDLINNIVRVTAGFVSINNSNEKYNYGFWKIQHLLIMTPGILFASSGLFNVVSPLVNIFFAHEDLAALTLGPTVLSAITFTSFTEFYLYYKNIGEVSSDSTMTLFNKIKSRARASYSVLKKTATGSVEDQIIIENSLSLFSAMTPVISTVLSYSSGYQAFDLLGQILNGSFQAYHGFLIARENTLILIGKSLKKEEREKIVKIITSHKGIEKVENLKSSWSIGQLAISLEIKLNEKLLAKYMLKLMDKKIKETGLNQEATKQLMTKFSYLLLAKTTEVCRSTEKKIQEAFEYGENIDIQKGYHVSNPDLKKDFEKNLNEVLKEEQEKSNK